MSQNKIILVPDTNFNSKGSLVENSSKTKTAFHSASYFLKLARRKVKRNFSIIYNSRKVKNQDLYLHNYGQKDRQIN